MLKNFKTKILLHILLIALSLGASAYRFLHHGIDGLVVLLLIAATGAVYSLFRLVDKTNEELADFLLNIKYDDYTATYSVRQPDESFRHLHGAFNTITGKFRDIRQEKEAQFQYLQAIVEHVDTGLICFDLEGKTLLMNRALQRLLHKSYFPDMESITRFSPPLHEAMVDLQPGERQLVKLVIQNQIIQLAVRTTTLKLKNGEYHLYSLQNIRAELEEQEVESWQKLIRILTHEIMNSVAPVASLAATAGDLVGKFQTFDAESADDIRTAVQAIRKRSEGLLHFTETYRQLTRIPQPKFQSVDANTLLENVATLFKPTLAQQGIVLEKNFPPNPVLIQADPELLEQVFINLVKNAMESLLNSRESLVVSHEPEGIETSDANAGKGHSANPKPAIIRLSTSKDAEGAVLMQVADNGPGISPDLLDQIFVPFFTTKQEGSGIGLSLCRQIVHLHKGSLTVWSEEGKGTVFGVRV